MCYRHYRQLLLTPSKLPNSLIRLPKQCSGFASFRAAQTKESGMHSVFRRRWLFAVALTAAVFLVARVRGGAAEGGEPQSFAIRGATVVPVSGPRIENATL